MKNSRSKTVRCQPLAGTPHFTMLLLTAMRTILTYGAAAGMRFMLPVNQWNMSGITTREHTPSMITDTGETTQASEGSGFPELEQAGRPTGQAHGLIFRWAGPGSAMSPGDGCPTTTDTGIIINPITTGSGHRGFIAGTAVSAHGLPIWLISTTAAAISDGLPESGDMEAGRTL